jgi:hypothetical protein
MKMKAALLMLSVPMLFVLASCASKNYEESNAPHFSVSSEFAAFYRFGPMQGGGPDLSLRRGERLRVLRREMGYSFVKIQDGRTGYIANESIRPAPEPLPAPMPRPPRRLRNAAAPAPPTTLPTGDPNAPFPQFRF